VRHSSRPQGDDRRQDRDRRQAASGERRRDRPRRRRDSATTGSNVSDADLKAALEASITETRVFREVVQGRSGDYELTVSVTQLSKPMFGFSFTVEMEAGWTLTRVSDGRQVWRKAITSTHTVSANAAFAGATRLRMAVEGAAKANISQGLAEIGGLAL